MGAYINPIEETKEEFLAREGKEIEDRNPVRIWKEKPERYLPVVLIDNYIFTSAGIGFSERETINFLDPLYWKDSRPKRVFYCEIEKLHTVSKELKHYLRHANGNVSSL